MVDVRGRIRAWLAEPEPPRAAAPRMAATNTELARSLVEGPRTGPMTSGEADTLQERLRVFGRLDQADTARLVEAYSPSMLLAPAASLGGEALQASQVRGMREQNPRWFVPFMRNPRQSRDYYIIDTIATMTVMQSLISTKMRMIMGTGFRPALYLKKPSADGKSGDEEIAAKEKDDARLQELAWIVDVMEAADRRVSLGDGNVLKATVFSQFSSLIRGTIVYNRGALVRLAVHLERRARLDDKRAPVVDDRPAYEA